MKRLPLITSFILFIALCVTVAYWTMQLYKPPVRAVAAPPQAVQPAPSLDAAANLLGGRSTVAVASNYQLKGVVVGSNPAESVAILAANGKPARAVKMNAQVLPGITLKEVNRQYVLLSVGGAIKRVELATDTKTRMKVALSDHVSTNAQPPMSAVEAAEPVQPIVPDTRKPPVNPPGLPNLSRTFDPTIKR